MAFYKLFLEAMECYIKQLTDSSAFVKFNSTESVLLNYIKLSRYI